jgi:hypothetical protein
MGKLQNANIVEILIFLFMYRLEEKKLFLIFIHFQYVQSSGFHTLIFYKDVDLIMKINVNTFVFIKFNLSLFNGFSYITNII